MLLRLVASSLVVAALTAPATAQAPVQTAPKKVSKSEERICENIIMTGSRLAKKRFCGTRAEWADKQLQDRKMIEQIQTSPCMLNKTGPNGRPSC